ncbi:hypothetical protein Dimus_030017 [Dionaea muscipula]
MVCRSTILQYEQLSFLYLLKARTNGMQIFRHLNPALLYLECFLIEQVITLVLLAYLRFKNNGQNFDVMLSMKAEPIQDVSIPEDLLQVQAYMMWQRKWKHFLTER